VDKKTLGGIRYRINYEKVMAFIVKGIDA